MEHKMRTIIALAFLLGDLTNGKVKDPDEDKAYEFGFTIEGMQHRHEKKDVNGIIQGEFGFITADGVYHVTVYATDENGNFRIISMKNIKVSPPLDGSPDFGSTKYSPLPKAAPPAQSAQSSRPETSPQSFQLQQRTQIASTKRPNRAFTTQPTLKPACAGCGYVTTSKKPPVASVNTYSRPEVNYSGGGHKFLPESLNRFSSDTPPSKIPTGIFEPPKVSPGSVYPSSVETKGPNDLRTMLPTEVLSPHKPSLNGIPDDFKLSVQKSPKYSSSYTGSKNIESPMRNGDGPLLGPQIFENRFGDLSNRKTEQGHQGSFPSLPNSFSISRNEGRPEQNSFEITNRNPELVKVSNGVIKIPGNPDITIKDKYPGMVDGLPDGINEKDITNILYRFNWTVGFQGHYETGYKNGAKVGGYFVNGSDGISRVVTYVADEFGYRPKVRIINIGLDSPDTPKDDKTFELKSFEFVWYPVK